MEDSLKSLLITTTIILIFITCILNFIVLFPQEQGITFSDNQSQIAYLEIGGINNTGEQSLNILSNSSNSAFNTWDVTTGFMGSNSMKQGQSGVKTSIFQIFDSLLIISKQLFTSNSPIV
jgi:hypothetical protein